MEKNDIRLTVLQRNHVLKDSFQPAIGLRVALVNFFNGTIIKEGPEWVLPIELARDIKKSSKPIDLKTVEIINYYDLLQLPPTIEPTGDIIQDSQEFLKKMAEHKSDYVPDPIKNKLKMEL